MSAADEIRILLAEMEDARSKSGSEKYSRLFLLSDDLTVLLVSNAEAIAELIEAADKVATVHYRVEQDCFRKLRDALAKLNTGKGETP